MPADTDNRKSFLEARNCIIPKDRFYDPVKHQWIKAEEDGTLVMGLTDVAQTLAGKLLHVTPKPAGTHRDANKSLVVYEAAKWIGVINVPFDSTVVAHNPKVVADAFIVNQFPYADGWIIRLRPDEAVDLSQHFVSPEDAQAIYAAQLDEGIIDDCVHCIGFEV